MKKFFGVAALAAFCALPVRADTMNFITVLSSPVGTFNRVEEVDTQTPVTSPVINFCTSLGSGSIRLNGNANPTAAGMTLSNGTTLGGNVSEYRLQSLTMNDRGTLNGSRLLANTVNANTMPTLVRSFNIYANTLTVQGAKTGGLNVGDGKSVMSGTESNRKMVWSNEYQKNKNNVADAAYAKQFLLKSTVSSGSDYEQGEFKPGTEKTYKWVRTSLNELMCTEMPLECRGSLLSTAATSDTRICPGPDEGQCYYNTLPPEELTAVKPVCSEDTVNQLGYTGKRRVKEGSVGTVKCYCPTYTCKAI